MYICVYNTLNVLSRKHRDWIKRYVSVWGIDTDTTLSRTGKTVLFHNGSRLKQCHCCTGFRYLVLLLLTTTTTAAATATATAAAATATATAATTTTTTTITTALNCLLCLIEMKWSLISQLNKLHIMFTVLSSWESLTKMWSIHVIEKSATRVGRVT